LVQVVLAGKLRLLLQLKEPILFLDHQFLHLQQIQQLLLVAVMVVAENIKEHQVVLVAVEV
jgi:hypothetical protein